jgi:hypothetical protein
MGASPLPRPVPCKVNEFMVLVYETRAVHASENLCNFLLYYDIV